MRKSPILPSRDRLPAGSASRALHQAFSDPEPQRRQARLPVRASLAPGFTRAGDSH